MQWQWAKIDSLSARDVHGMYQLRQAVFVLEQTCLYPDIDALDLQAWHLLGWQAQTLVAYARLFEPGIKYSEPAMGRVVTAPTMRGRQLGRQLVAKALACSEATFGTRAMRISAQLHLRAFYESFGFICEGEAYDEDGIPHIEMFRATKEP
ncbi:GNAT family N-acetyltransferase [Salinimonas chungwhensis]|uniref:GNAT family N-acetyltransferase n=1 Tax=Salinimonas chungwhensis TaxID=265425 RepID=UPI00036412FC|nr:GNAT family N-acetyltransferase [Salinimonas chungwhensis]